MAALALVGITGMYLSQVASTALLGLIGYLVFAAGYLVIMCIAFVAAYVLPAVARPTPATSTTSSPSTPAAAPRTGDIGALQTVHQGRRASPTWPAASLRHRAVPGPRPDPLGGSAPRRRRRRSPPRSP